MTPINALKALAALAKRHGTRPLHAYGHMAPDGSLVWQSHHLTVTVPAQHRLASWPAEGAWLPLAGLAQAACTEMEYVAGDSPTVRAGSSILRPLVGEDAPVHVRPSEDTDDCGSFSTQDLADVFRAADREGNAVLCGVHVSPTHMEATDGKSLFCIARHFDACPSVIIPAHAVEALVALGKGSRWSLAKAGRVCRAQSGGMDVAFQAVDGTYPAVSGCLQAAAKGTVMDLGPAAAAVASRKWPTAKQFAVLHASGIAEDELGEWGADVQRPLALDAPLGIDARRLTEAVAFAGTGMAAVGRGILWAAGERQALVMPVSLADPGVRPRQAWPTFAGTVKHVRKAAPDEVTRLRQILDAHGIAY